MSGVRLFRKWNSGHRWGILLCLVGGAIFTVPACWLAHQHRLYERNEQTKLAAQPVIVNLTSRLEAIEEKLMALRILWSASQKVDPAEWEVALDNLKLHKHPEVKALGVVQLSKNGAVPPSTVGDASHCCDRDFVYLSFFDVPPNRRQELSSFVSRVCCALYTRPGARRHLIPADEYLAAAVRAERVFLSPEDGNSESWIILALDPQPMLAEVATSWQFGGALILQYGNHEWRHATPTSVVSGLASDRETSGLWEELSWYGQVFRVGFYPDKIRADAIHEWLPGITLMLGFLGTGLAVLAVTHFERLRTRFARVRQRLVQLLNDTERRYQKVFEHVHHPVLIVDRELRIQECNPAAITFLGQSPVGRSFCDFCPQGCTPEHELSLCRWLNPSSPDTDSWLLETCLQSSGEQTREVLGLVSRLELAQGTSYVITLIDMTEHKAVQRQLEEYARSLQAANIRLRAYSQEIENAARAKITLLASMSHEIRTPLSAILGYARLLSEEILRRFSVQQSENSASKDAGGTENVLSSSEQPSGQPDALILEATEGLIRNSEHLLEMINTILDFSKLESGRMEVERIPTDPIAIAQDVVHMLAGKAREKNLRLELEVKGAIPQTIQSDPTRLRQILVNLTDNAIKFTREGRVWIEIELDRTPVDQPVLEFRVCDTGVGMSPDQIGRLFQPFRQGEAGTYRQYGGTGLGLLISRRLARLLGGDISVESTPGKGTIFHVRVATGPLENVSFVEGQEFVVTGTAGRSQSMAKGQESSLAPHSPRNSQAVSGPLKGRVLVAEDFLDNRRLVQRILEKAGLTVTTVENGRDAIAQYRQARHHRRPFDLILMDVEMPEMDGITAVRELRQSGCTVPILALTAHNDPRCVEQFLESGFSGYVPKPVYQEQLLEAVAQFLGKSYSQSGDSPSNWKEPWEVEKTSLGDLPILTAAY
ncbi:MAG: ATP-binding protein [Thermogutta sp.]